jgi:hypothetical protein
MGDPFLKNMSKLMTGQRNNILSDSESDNKKEYLLILKPCSFLSLIRHEQITKANNNGQK